MLVNSDEHEPRARSRKRLRHESNHWNRYWAAARIDNRTGRGQGARQRRRNHAAAFDHLEVVGRPDIKSVQDLRGKKISISQFGSATDFAVQAALEKFGVDPKQVTVIQLGPSSNRLTALTNGSTEASLFTEPFATMAIEKHRMNLLLDMAEAGMSYPQSCLMIKRSFLDANRDKATSFAKALIEGMFLANKDKALTIQTIKKYIRAADEVYGIGYDYFLGKHAEGLLSMPDRKGVELVIRQLARTNPNAKGQTPETLRVFEPSILDELKTSGFIEKARK